MMHVITHGAQNALKKIKKLLTSCLDAISDQEEQQDGHQILYMLCQCKQHLRHKNSFRFLLYTKGSYP